MDSFCGSSLRALIGSRYPGMYCSRAIFMLLDAVLCRRNNTQSTHLTFAQTVTDSFWGAGWSVSKKKRRIATVYIVLCTAVCGSSKVQYSAPKSAVDLDSTLLGAAEANQPHPVFCAPCLHTPHFMITEISWNSNVADLDDDDSTASACSARRSFYQQNMCSFFRIDRPCSSAWDSSYSCLLSLFLLLLLYSV